MRKTPIPRGDEHFVRVPGESKPKGCIGPDVHNGGLVYQCQTTVFRKWDSYSFSVGEWLAVRDAGVVRVEIVQQGSDDLEAYGDWVVLDGAAKQVTTQNGPRIFVPVSAFKKPVR
jgi:hypothetical protein